MISSAVIITLMATANLSANSLDLTQLKDVIDVLKKCCFPYIRWFDLGLELGLWKMTLDIIEKNHSSDIPRCLTECLSKWLSRVDNVDHRGGATWHSLNASLRSMDEKAVADKLEQEIECLTHGHGIHLNVVGATLVSFPTLCSEGAGHETSATQEHFIATPSNSVSGETRDEFNLDKIHILKKEALRQLSGEIPRGSSKIKWNIKHELRGLKLMWKCKCHDTQTGQIAEATKNSRDGALEHSLRKLI